jgi:5-methylcytosine-specific restriction enzyme A
VDKYRFCAQPGCTGVALNSRFCPLHIRDNYLKRRVRPDADSWYARAAWKKTRLMKLRRDPICEDCNRAPATEVHHTDSSWKETGDWGLFLTIEKLQSLCHDCHSRKTMKQNHEKGVFSNG